MSFLIGMIAKIVGEKAAPLVFGALVLGAIGLIRFDAYNDGKNSIKAQIAEKAAEARREEQERFFAREQITTASYQAALVEALKAQNAQPQIIREIRDAPETQCSSMPIGIERVRLLNAAITGNRNQDS